MPKPQTDSLFVKLHGVCVLEVVAGREDGARRVGIFFGDPDRSDPLGLSFKDAATLHGALGNILERERLGIPHEEEDSPNA